jgi:lysophospholipid acyltransferase (LPLAT)-like uncharacterized protein
MSDRTRTWKDKVRLEISASLITLLARIWFGTVRVKVLNREVYEKYFKGSRSGHVVAGSWHRHSIFLFYFFRNLGSRAIMISRSMDGELTARIAKRLGYTPIRGSSSKGGEKALDAMIDFLNHSDKKRLCGTPVDGPRGPARQMKKGMLALAKETGAVFIPMACSGNRVITLKRAWDKTILPKPFSRVMVDFDEPVFIPNDVTDEAFEKIRQDLEVKLDQLTDKVDRLCGYTGVQAA